MVLSEPIKNLLEGAMVETYRKLIKRLNDAGIFPKKHILDNEISKGYKEAIKENGMTWVLVPVGMHRRNVAGGKNFKVNFKSILCGVAGYFTMNLCDCLIPQAELTCNLLHQSNMVSEVSAQAYTFGRDNSNRMPLAPIGCAVKIHEKPSKRKTWGVHSVEGWYLQTYPHHYRCFEVWIKHTGAERISDTVYFKHKHITNPTVSPDYALVHAAKYLTSSLQRRIPSVLERSTVQELEQLDNIFNQTAVT